MNSVWPGNADKGRDLYEKFATHVRQEKRTELPLFYSLSRAMRRVWDNLAAELEPEDWSDDDD
jgi:hypothetical protein